MFWADFIEDMTDVLLHSFWQAGLISIFLAVFFRFSKFNAVVRYYLSLLALVILIVAMQATYSLQGPVFDVKKGESAESRLMDRSARIDGASRFQTLMKIILPVAAPGVFSTALLVFIFAFNEFLFALMLTVDYRSRTIPVGIALFEGIHGQIPWGEIMAAATITTIPVVILTLIFQKRIVQGLTRGAVKQ